MRAERKLNLDQIVQKASNPISAPEADVDVVDGYGDKITKNADDLTEEDIQNMRKTVQTKISLLNKQPTPKEVAEGPEFVKKSRQQDQAGYASALERLDKAEAVLKRKQHQREFDGSN